MTRLEGVVLRKTHASLLHSLTHAARILNVEYFWFPRNDTFLLVITTFPRNSVARKSVFRGIPCTPPLKCKMLSFLHSRGRWKTRLRLLSSCSLGGWSGFLCARLLLEPAQTEQLDRYQVQVPPRMFWGLQPFYLKAKQ